MIDATQTLREHEIFLTGANGFVGKVLFGLILERFPGFKHLHILVRSKGATPARDRFYNDVLSSPALKPVVDGPSEDLLRRKVTVHSGDIADPLCGLSEESADALAGRVALIVNCAGLVEFFPPVDESFRPNVDGVENVVALAKRLGAKLLHVSTCFVCGESDGLVEESEPILGFYPRRRGPQDHSFRHADEIRYMRERIREVKERASGGRPPRAKEIAQQLIDVGKQRAAQWGWVNIYTYSKSLGEQIIAAEPGLDYVLVRPAIVEAALEFPFPGWVEGGRTAAPLIMMAMSGMRHWPLRTEAPLEVVPVDLVASAILTAAVLQLNGQSARVYHVAAADANPITLGSLVEWMHEDYLKSEGRSRLFHRGVRIITPERGRRRRRKMQARLIGLQRLAVGVRKMLQRSGLPGRRQLASIAIALRMLGLQLTFREQMLELYQPFILDNRFIFEAENIRGAHARLSEADRRLLPWAPHEINWRRYWSENEVKGILKWVAADMMKGRSFHV